MAENRFLILGEARYAADWARKNNLPQTRWVRVDQDGQNILGLEGPWRKETSPFILIETHFERGYYRPEVFDMLQYMGFRL